MIQFCLKIYDLWRHSHLWVSVWVVGWMNGLMGGVMSNHLISNKSWPNWDNSILCEDLWFVETPSPLGGYLGVLIDGSFFWHFDFLLKPPQSITGLFLTVDILCISNNFGHFLAFLLKPPQPFTGLFLFLFLVACLEVNAIHNLNCYQREWHSLNLHAISLLLYTCKVTLLSTVHSKSALDLTGKSCLHTSYGSMLTLVPVSSLNLSVFLQLLYFV